MSNFFSVNTTIELVGPGHPDRFADYVSEKILVEILKQDKNAKVACEVIAMRDLIVVGGEVSTNAKLNYQEIVLDCIKKIYGKKWWPNYEKLDIKINIHKQSIELEVHDNEIVAGDQGVIYGYWDSKRFDIIKKLYSIVNKLITNFNLAPDWKLLYDIERKELSISICGAKKNKFSLINKFLSENLSKMVEKVIVNPKGEWMIPGPLSDTGLTGRKLMIDTFGSGIPHGGGAFCGKDFSKVDKTGIIIASYLAKEVLTLHQEETKALVELSYKIGDKLPTAYAFVGKKKINISSNVNLELHQYIETYKLNEQAWDEYVVKGGIIFYLTRK